MREKIAMGRQWIEEQSLPKRLAWVMGLALAVRLILWVALLESWRWNSGVFHDNWNVLALHFYQFGDVTNEWGEPILIRPPGFIFFLAFLHHLFGEDYRLWSLAIVLFDSCVAGYVLWLAGRVWGSFVGSVAGLYHATHLPVIFYCCQIEQFIFTVPFFFTWVCGVTLLIQKGLPSWGRVIALGLLSGWLILNKSVYLTFPLFVLPLLFFLRGKSSGYEVVKAGMAILLCTAIVVTPWAVRNYQVSGGRLIPSQLLMWYNFMADVYWDELDATEGSWRPGGKLHRYIDDRLLADPVIQKIKSDPQLSAAEKNMLFEDRCKALSFQWMEAHPWGVVRKTLKNSYQFWVGAENGQKTWLFAAMQLPYLLLLGYAIWRVMVSGQFQAASVLLLSIGVLWAQYSAIYAMGRFSLDLVPMMGVLLGMAWKAEEGFPRRSPH